MSDTREEILDHPSAHVFTSLEVLQAIRLVQEPLVWQDVSVTDTEHGNI